MIVDPNNVLNIAAIDSRNPNEKNLDVPIGLAGGQSNQRIIDYNDIRKFDPKSRGTTPLTAVFHEVVEGWYKMLNPNSPLKILHSMAINSENRLRSRLGLPQRLSEGFKEYNVMGWKVIGPSIINYDGGYIEEYRFRRSTKAINREDELIYVVVYKR